MLKIRHFFLLTSFLLSGCHFTLLHPAGRIALDEKNLLILSVLLMLIVVIPVIVLTLFFAWRYRDSNTNAAYAPHWSHSTIIEIICWSIPCVIIGVLGAITWTSSHSLDPYRPLAAENKTITIQAIALQWKWLFIYPEQHIATVNFVALPINQPVKFLITSEGPMNSLQIPQLAGQIYAMARMQTQLHLIANKIGDYRGFSANFSGDGFSEMKFIARISSKTQFDQWVKATQNTTEKLSMAEYRRLMKPSMHEAIHYYSSPAPNLFNIAIMKSMMPMNEDGTHIHTHLLSKR